MTLIRRPSARFAFRAGGRREFETMNYPRTEYETEAQRAERLEAEAARQRQEEITRLQAEINERQERLAELTKPVIHPACKSVEIPAEKVLEPKELNER
jgi:hypothetical protein